MPSASLPMHNVVPRERNMERCNPLFASPLSFNAGSGHCQHVNAESDPRHVQSPRLDCQSVIAATAAVSARSTRGPSETETTCGIAPIMRRSASENPPSGPIRMAQGPDGPESVAPLPANISSQNINLRSAGHVSRIRASADISSTRATLVSPHCFAASMAWT